MDHLDQPDHLGTPGRPTHPAHLGTPGRPGRPGRPSHPAHLGTPAPAHPSRTGFDQ
jgi:hypothetical protein